MLKIIVSAGRREFIVLTIKNEGMASGVLESFFFIFRHADKISEGRI